MVDLKPLIAIYSYRPMIEMSGDFFQKDEEREGACFEIIHFFSEFEHLEKEWLRNIYNKAFDQIPWEGHKIGPFENLAAINHFVLKVSDELKSPLVYLLSVSDYNQGLESIFDVKSFPNIFSQYGKKLVNSGIRGDRPRFLKRIFKEV